MPPRSSSPWTLGGPPRQFLVKSASPLRCEPSFGQVTSPWLEMAVDDRLPIPTVLGSALSWLSPATEAIAFQCSNATNAEPAVEIASAIASGAPFLLPSEPLQVTAPGLPLASRTQPLLVAPVSEQHGALNPAYLHPSLPSPWSLITWTQSLTILIPACQPSDVSRPATIALNPRQGHVDALPPSSPSRRGQRLTPLKPQPNEVVWMPVAPIEASLQPTVNQPIGPGQEGTAPPPLAAVRSQPASLPVRPLASSASGIQRGTGPAASGLSSADTLKLTCLNMAHGISKLACGVRSESGTALPSISIKRYAFSIAMAPCSHMIEWCPMPPGPLDSTVQSFSAVKRSARSITAGLPGPCSLTITKVPPILD